MHARRAERGQGLVEFAVIFPIFALILFSVIDGGLLMGRYNNVNNGAKEGARLGAVGAGVTDIANRVMAQTHGELPNNTTIGCGSAYSGADNAVCVQWIQGADGESPGTVGASVRVEVKYTYTFLTPIVKQIGTWTVTACAIQRQELAISAPSANTNSTATSCSDAQ